jgi:sRNA-binding carbon storage regulator CsrA
MKKENDFGYLGLTIRKGDVIKIGDDIEVIFRSRIQSRQVGVAIKAPRSMIIKRGRFETRNEVQSKNPIEIKKRVTRRLVRKDPTGCP